jgi:hypothetical protein
MGMDLTAVQSVVASTVLAIFAFLTLFITTSVVRLRKLAHGKGAPWRYRDINILVVASFGLGLLCGAFVLISALVFA